MSWIRVVVACCFVVSVCASPALGDEKRREELALELMSLTGETTGATATAAAILSQLKAGFPTVTDEEWREVEASFDAQQLVQVSVGVYAKYFDESDLAGLVEFYKTPLGKKLIAGTPNVLREIAMGMNEWAQGKAQEIHDRLRAAGHEPQGM